MLLKQKNNFFQLTLTNKAKIVMIQFETPPQMKVHHLCNKCETI